MKAHMGTTLGAVPIIQSLKTRLLLANYKDRLYEIRPQMRQIPVIYANIKSSSRGTHVYDQPGAIFHLGNRLYRSTSQRERQCTVRSSGCHNFTKWVEVEALASITPVKTKEFVYKTSFISIESPTPSYPIMEHSSTATNSKSSAITSRSKKFSCRSHDLRPMGKSKLWTRRSTTT